MEDRPEVLTKVKLKQVINAKDEFGDTALLRACKHDRHELVAKLISPEVRANPNICDAEGRSPLHWSAELGDLKSLEALLNAGAYVNAHDHQNDTPVVRAIKQNHVEAVKLLIEAGCDWHDVDGLNSTALTLVSLLGRCQIIELLLEKGDDVNEIGDYGMTPLMCAALEGHVETTKMLLSHGADPNARGRYSGSNALVNASYVMDSPEDEARHEIVRYLLQANADPNQTVCATGDSLTRTASGLSSCIHYAILTGYISLIHMYLLSGLHVTHSMTRQFLPGEIHDLLYSWTSNPPPLIHLCRSRIRRSLGLHVQKKILGLHLPSQIRKILALEQLDWISPRRVYEAETKVHKSALYRCSNALKISGSYLSGLDKSFNLRRNVDVTLDSMFFQQDM